MLYLCGINVFYVESTVCQEAIYIQSTGSHSGGTIAHDIDWEFISEFTRKTVVRNLENKNMGTKGKGSKHGQQMLRWAKHK